MKAPAIKAHGAIRGRRRRARLPYMAGIALGIAVCIAAMPSSPAARSAPPLETLETLETRDEFEQAGRYTLARKQAKEAAAAEDAFAVGKSVADKAGLGDLSEAIAVHHDSIQLRDLLTHLIPDGWELRLEIPQRAARQIIAFHAETSRRRALDDLLKKLNLRGAFYPGAGLLLVSKS